MAEGFSPASLAGFELFFRPWMRSRIRIRFTATPSLPSDSPLLVAANHTSWWDPFVIRELHRRIRPRDPLYTLMLEGELERRPFFRRIGVVGIDPDSPASIRAALKEIEKRVAIHPSAVILFFPQGRIWPSGRRPLGFRRGVDLFASHLGPLHVLPIALHLEALNAVKPTVFSLPAQPFEVPAGGNGAGERAEAAIVEQLDRLERHLHLHGEAAARIWPPEESS